MLLGFLAAAGPHCYVAIFALHMVRFFFFFSWDKQVWISESCWHNMLQAASLYSIKSILILDSEGARIAAKYYTSGTA